MGGEWCGVDVGLRGVEAWGFRLGSGSGHVEVCGAYTVGFAGRWVHDGYDVEGHGWWWW